jgi:EamA domain-containing membrane protein RarD
MKKHEVTIPLIGLVAGTRAMLGAGIALLLSERLTDEQRRAIGWTLVAVGALTTIPLVVQLLGATNDSNRRRLSVHSSTAREK